MRFPTNTDIMCKSTECRVDCQHPENTIKSEKHGDTALLARMLPGSVLASQDPTVQVLSALEGLTVVFGMGTGVSPPPWPPDSRLQIHVVALRQMPSRPRSCTEYVHSLSHSVSSWIYSRLFASFGFRSTAPLCACLLAFVTLLFPHPTFDATRESFL